MLHDSVRSWRLKRRLKPLVTVSRPTVWMYWADPPGSTEADRPSYISACLETVRRTGGCDVVVVSPETISTYADGLHPAFWLLTPNHQSDVFRTHMLYRYGGMYIDADTVVVRSLRPLFERLAEVDFVAADWRPAALPEERRESLGITIMGPSRPRLPLLAAMIQRQEDVLRRHHEELVAGGDYPIPWGALLGDFASELFERYRPKAEILDGTETWYAFCGARDFPAAYGYPWDRAEDVEIPDSDLFSFWNSYASKDPALSDLDALLAGDLLLGKLLRIGLGLEPLEEK
jgi:hypothetical protein